MSESKYRMGWFIVIFDLPVTTKEQRRAATKFRNDLLNKGYLMLQFSVYARCAVTFDRKEKIISELKEINPCTGDIRCIFITDAQWEQTMVLSARNGKSPYKIKKQESQDQLQFW